MKKFVSIALALVLTLSLAVVAFAALPDETVVDETAFTATYETGSSNSDAKVYGVAVQWDKTAFTCTWGDVYKWNPETLKYDTLDNEATGGSWDATTATVTVTNKSNAAIQFKLESDNETDLSVTEGAAYTTIVGATVDTPKTGTGKVTLNRAAAKTGDSSIATITVTVKAA